MALSMLTVMTQSNRPNLKALFKARQSRYNSQCSHTYSTKQKPLADPKRNPVIRDDAEAEKKKIMSRNGIYVPGLKKIYFPYLIKWVLHATKTDKGGSGQQGGNRLGKLDSSGAGFKNSLSMLGELKRKVGLDKKPGEKPKEEPKKP